MAEPTQAPGHHTAAPTSASCQIRSVERPSTLAAADFKLQSIDLYITAACNRKCGYCFLPDSYFASRAQMTVETVQAIVQWAARGTVDEVTILGGEPALHPHFAEVISTVAESPVRVRTVTNGSSRFRDALHDDVVRNSLSRVAVSLDAPYAAVVDRLRGPGAFADALASIDSLKSAGIPFDVNCTAVATALDSMAEMLEFADSIGADRLNIHWFSQVGRARTHARGESVSALDWRHKVLDVVSRYQPRRTNFVPDCESAFAYGMPGEDSGKCAVRDMTNLQFLPSGAVFSCGMLVEDDVRSGYLWQDGALTLRPGASEITETSAGCVGCPLRVTDDGHAPVCIYNRLVLS
jgi:MoaA/NifB/PqqE/SkfB family radical SAM enzyme